MIRSSQLAFCRWAAPRPRSPQGCRLLEVDAGQYRGAPPPRRHPEESTLAAFRSLHTWPRHHHSLQREELGRGCTKTPTQNHSDICKLAQKTDELPCRQDFKVNNKKPTSFSVNVPLNREHPVDLGIFPSQNGSRRIEWCFN